MRNFFHVARNTFRECLREPIYMILLLASVYLILLFPSLSLFVFREQIKLVIDSSMATTLVFGLVTAVFCSSHTISREMENGTVLLLLSKPVPRWSFILSKMAGVLSALSVFVFICSVSTLISIRVARDQFQLDFLSLSLFVATIKLCLIWGGIRNFFSHKSFAASTCHALQVTIPLLLFGLMLIPENVEGFIIQLNVLPALILIFFAVWAMVGITVMLSTKLDMVANLLISSLLFFGGLMSDYFLGESAGTVSWKGILYAVIPNWQFFWLADALTNKQVIPISYVAWAGVYIVLYMTLCSIITVTLFSDKEVGQNVK